VVRAVEALLAAGISVCEVTMTVPGAIGVIRNLVERFGDRVLVGAGTVLSADDAASCIDAGARFIVSPGLDLPTIDAAHDRDIAVLPGALTPTEVITA
jgi:2-dehydro-3-deoxyphosphogluconate aldolase/(4S)-4-hydroxy-2-oxoglutarate aldolase